MNDFIAFDVETANPDLASICQIGIARFADGQLCEKPWEQVINPQDYFHPRNVAVHGINEGDVHTAKTFPQVVDALLERLGSAVVIHHTPFDRTAMKQVFAKHGLVLPPIKWLDSACVVRRTWPDLARAGYGLESVAGRLAIAYQAHSAAEDARAAGEVFIHAMRQSGLSVADWIVRAGEPITPRSRNGTASKKTDLDGNEGGPLYGETAVFTGDFSVVKWKLEEMAAEAGSDVHRGYPTKATTLLVVGDVDLRKTKGEDKTEKHRKAEELAKKGQKIRFLRETDFRAHVDDALAGR